MVKVYENYRKVFISFMDLEKDYHCVDKEVLSQILQLYTKEKRLLNAKK